MIPTRDISNNSFSQLYQNKLFFYFVLSAVSLLVILKLPMAHLYYETVSLLITFAPLAVIAIMAILAYINSKRYPDYQMVIRKFYLIFTLKILSTILLFYIFYSPSLFIVPLKAFFKYLATLLTLESVFFFLSYFSTLVIAAALIFVFFRAYQKSQGKYLGSIQALTRKTLYALFAFFFLIFTSSAAAYPQSYQPLTDTLGDTLYTLSSGTVKVFKGDNPEAYAKIESLGSFTTRLSNSITQTTQNISTNNQEFKESLTLASTELKNSITQSSQDLSDKIKTDLSGKVDTIGGEMTGSLKLSGNDSDLTVEGTTTTKNILPDDSLSYDLGSSSKSWNTIYAHRLIGASPIFIGTNSSSRGLNGDGDLVISNDTEIQGTLYGQAIFAQMLTIAGAYTLPTSDGAANEIMATDGNGNVTWTQNITPGGTTGTIQFNSGSTFAGDTELFWDNANKRLGIGTATPATELEVSGTAKATAFMLPGGIYLNADSVTTNYWMETSGNIYRESGNIGLGNNSPQERLDLNGRLRLRQITAPVDPTDRLYNVLGNLFWNGIELGENFWTKTGNDVAFNLTGNVGIGKAPTTKLDVSGTISATNFFDATSSAYLTPGSVNANYWGGSGGNIYRETGNVGIGTNSPSGLLHVASTSPFVVTADGNVGMGTTSPETALDITGDLTVRLDEDDEFKIIPAFQSVQMTFDGGTLVHSRVGPTLFSVGGINNSGAMFQVEGNASIGSGFSSTAGPTNGLIVEGNVGIGTVSPGQALDVRGASIFGSGDTGNSIRLGYNITPAGGSTGMGLWAIGGGDIWLKGYDETYIGYNKDVTITDAGDVGIGTVSPGAKLQINKIGEAIRFNEQFYSISASTGSAGILGLNSLHKIVFNPGGSGAYIFTMNYDGSSSVLEQDRASKIFKLGQAALNSDVASSPFYVYGQNAYSSALTNLNGGDVYVYGGAKATGGTDGNLILAHNGSSALGNVGIGTTDPTAKLHVNGDFKITDGGSGSIALALTSSGANSLKFTGSDFHGDSTGDFLIRETGNAATPQYSFTSPYNNTGIFRPLGISAVAFSTTGTERMRIDPSGNVGIGTTSPGEKLEVNGTIKISDLRIGGSLDNTERIALNGTGNVAFGARGIFQFWADNNNNNGSDNLYEFYTQDSMGAGTPKVVINESGSIGIGTTSPLASLDIASPNVASPWSYTATNKGQLFVRTTDSQAVNKGGMIELGDSNFGYAGIRGSFEGGTSAGYLSLHTGENASGQITEKMRITSLGNVGIGTTAPQGKLDIAGTGGVQWGSGTQKGLVNIGTNGTAGGSLYVNTPGLAGNGYGAGLGVYGSHSGTISTVNVTAFATYTGGYSSDLAFSTTYGATLSERMRIVGISGNVGIGTTTPTSRLHGVTTLSAATGDEVAYSLDYTTNKLTSGNDTGLLISMTDTASPGTSNLLDLQVGGVSNFSINNTGEITGNVSAGGLSLFGQSIARAKGALISGTYLGTAYNNNQFDFLVSAAGGNMIDIGKDFYLGFSNLSFSNANSFRGSADTRLYRLSAGVLSLGGSANDSSGTLIAGNVGIGTTTPTSRLHGVTTLSADTGDEVAYELDYTTNKLTSGNDTGLKINMTDTASPGTSNLLDLQVGGVSKFNVDNTGNVTTAGASIIATQSSRLAWLATNGSAYIIGLGTGLVNNRMLYNAQFGMEFRTEENASSGNAFTFTPRAGTVGKLTASSGNQAYVGILPLIQQSGTAGYSGLLINVNESTIGSGNNYLIDAQVGGASKFAIDNTGNLTASGSTITLSALADGSLSIVGGVITSSSDERKKDKVTDMDSVLEKVLKLDPLIYTWKDSTPEGIAIGHKQQIGFFAQDMEKHFPQLVGENKEGMKGLNYNGYTAVLTKAIQEQQGQIEDLQVQSLKLKVESDSLNLRVDGVESRTANLENLAQILQDQIDQLQTMANQELNLAQIDANTIDISYLKTLLGIDPENPGSINLVGQLSAEGIETGKLIIKIIDTESPTIGTGIIKAGEAEVIIETKAVNVDSKIFVSLRKAEKVIPIKVGEIVAGESFMVEIGEILEGAIEFDWWIVEMSN